MKVIHRLSRTTVVFSLTLTFALQTNVAATRRPAQRQPRRPAKEQRQRQAQNPRARRAEKNRAATKVNRGERRRIEARQRAEAARLAALARERAAEEAMRDRVQSLIANDDARGEDPEIRRIAVNALGNHAGTVVVMNPRTGQVYSIVNQQWALREGFKPCSTIKLVTGLAGLNEGVIDREDTTAISDSNRVSLTSALAHSKNEYFQTVGGRVGFTKMISYARQLGLGEKTGINVRNESAGRVPQSKSGLAVNHMSSHGDDFKVTALQLATLVSAMSNGGKLLKPFVGPSTAPKIRRIVDINSDAFQTMRPGMIGAVSYGSGHRAYDSRETIAGKTGTCIEHGEWIGLFTSYAPVNDPELAIVVIAKGNDGRNHFPAAVAGRIYRDLNSRFAAAGSDVAATPASANNQPAIASDADVDTDEEEADESTADSSSNSAPRPADSGKTIWGDQRRPADSKVKATLMSIPPRTVPATTPANERLRRMSGQFQ